MTSRYKYDDAYVKYQSLSLRKEFDLLSDYLLFDKIHANEDAFAAADEIYHWFCIKQEEVDELRAIDGIEQLACAIKDAKAIIEARKNKGWSKAKLAREADMNASTVSLIESGRYIPYESQVEKLARVLGLEG